MYCLVIGRVWIVVYIVWGYCGEYIVGGWLCYWFVCYFIGLVPHACEGMGLCLVGRV